MTFTDKSWCSPTEADIEQSFEEFDVNTEVIPKQYEKYLTSLRH